MSQKFRIDAPSNIALIKYWGKKGFQLPQNPSISMTLKNCKTIMDVEYTYDENSDKGFELEFLFEGNKKEDFEDKILAKIINLPEEFSFLQKTSLKINALNTFPHSSGIASSASSMACLAKAFAKIYFEIGNPKLKREQVSLLARGLSGSACRSLFPGFAYWGKNEAIAFGRDEYALPLSEDLIHPNFKKVKNTILVVDQNQKKVSTSDGHSHMKDHPYALTRYKIARENFEKIIQTIRVGDWEEFGKIVKSEALQLHALMLTSNNPYTLLKPNTLSVIEEIDQFIKDKKIELTYTLDAGPNLHLIYPEENQEKVEELIEKLDDQNLFQFVISDSINWKMNDDFLAS